jgi:hypothetical protein
MQRHTPIEGFILIPSQNRNSQFGLSFASFGGRDSVRSSKVVYCNTLGRSTLDKRSASRRDVYRTTHNIHNAQTPMPPVQVEPAIPATKRPQNYATYQRPSHWTRHLPVYCRDSTHTQQPHVLKPTSHFHNCSGSHNGKYSRLLFWTENMCTSYVDDDSVS